MTFREYKSSLVIKRKTIECKSTYSRRRAMLDTKTKSTTLGKNLNLKLGQRSQS